MKHEDLPEGWRWIKLGDVLEQQYRQEKLQEGTGYTTLGVRWYAGGTFIKQERDGDDISASYLNRVEEGDFIYNRLFAWKGSFAVVPAEHAGYYVSNEFPVFKIKASDQVDLEYLLWYTKRTHFWEYIATLSTGTSNASRLRYKEDDLLRESIPLPPIDEQRRIAEVLRDADANLVEIENAIAATEQIRKGFLERFICELEQVPPTRLNKALMRVKREVEVDPKQLYYQIGIRSHGKGIFHKEPITGKELGNKKIYWVEPGDFVLNIVFAWEGAVALVSENERGMCGSHRFPTFKFNTDTCLPEFLLFYFKTPTGVRQLEDVSPGGAGRNKTLNQGDFLKLKFPLPDLE
ncbi:MAG: restriction endonuclease subunit S, partial [Anaerolineae bacterium]|nr:restriction endonuclease subunit S [Anaerolineae bacterium]